MKILLTMLKMLQKYLYKQAPLSKYMHVSCQQCGQTKVEWSTHFEVVFIRL